jgi:hypothetical protein
LTVACGSITKDDRRIRAISKPNRFFMLLMFSNKLFSVKAIKGYSSKYLD